MNTPVSRQPQGIPAGGQFAAAAHSESDVVLLDPADRPISLAPGESDDFTEYADGDVITRLSVLRSDDGGTFHVEASKFVNFKDIIPAADLGTDEEGRDAWLDSNSAVIESFIRDRYDAGADTTDWDDVRVECGASIQADSVTGKQIADEAWNRSGIVQLHNESDHGTFGSENLGRLVREHVEAQAIPADIGAARGAAARMTASDIHNQVTERRLAERSVSDAWTYPRNCGRCLRKLLIRRTCRTHTDMSTLHAQQPKGMPAAGRFAVASHNRTGISVTYRAFDGQFADAHQTRWRALSASATGKCCGPANRTSGLGNSQVYWAQSASMPSRSRGGSLSESTARALPRPTTAIAIDL